MYRRDRRQDPPVNQHSVLFFYFSILMFGERIWTALSVVIGESSLAFIF
jgi:hypothetical protein